MQASRLLPILILWSPLADGKPSVSPRWYLLIFFASGKVRSDIVALCSLTALLLFHILTPEEALSGFSNSVVVMMVGLFVVGGAIFQTGLAKMISSRILKLAGKSELRLFILVMVVTAAIGAFVSNTGTVALMLPWPLPAAWAA